MIHGEEDILRVIHDQKGSERLVLLGNTNIRWDLVCVFMCFLTAQTLCVTTHEKQSLSIIEIFHKYQQSAEIRSLLIPVHNLPPTWTLVNTKQLDSKSKPLFNYAATSEASGPVIQGANP